MFLCAYIFNPFKNCRLLLQHCNSTARSGVITLSQPLSVCPLSSLSMATLFHIRLINQIKLLKEHGPENSSLVSNLIPSTTDNVSQKKGIYLTLFIWNNSIWVFLGCNARVYIFYRNAEIFPHCACNMFWKPSHKIFQMNLDEEGKKAYNAKFFF